VGRHGVQRRAPGHQRHQRGGIKGDKLVGVEYDDACDPKQAVAVANKIVNDGIQYVIGHLCSFHPACVRYL
jgi:ABC-type branched-subunit amino acid transport system substrate-binding protein